MRVMVFVKGDADTEAGVMPDEKLIAAMTEYNEQLVKAGILLDGGGLHPTSRRRTGEVVRRQADRRRRPVCGVQRGDRRLLAVGGQVDRRGRRVGEALPAADQLRVGD